MHFFPGVVSVMPMVWLEYARKRHSPITAPHLKYSRFSFFSLFLKITASTAQPMVKRIAKRRFGGI